jgi:hypothetical protein
VKDFFLFFLYFPPHKLKALLSLPFSSKLQNRALGWWCTQWLVINGDGEQ